MPCLQDVSSVPPFPLITNILCTAAGTPNNMKMDNEDVLRFAGVRTSPSHANLPQGFFRLILTECKACSRTSISRAHTSCLMGTLRPACEPFSQEGESQSVTLRLLPPYCSLNLTIFIDVDKGLHPVTSIIVSMLRSAIAQGRE